jgi:uncharacterized protein YjlB
MRAQVTSSSQSLSQLTGWHIHHCEGQFVYILDGWLDLEFAGGNVVRLATGDSLYIPGGTPHNEIQTADAFPLVEISAPVDMGTEACGPPNAWTCDHADLIRQLAVFRWQHILAQPGSPLPSYACQQNRCTRPYRQIRRERACELVSID